jgi:cyclic-di-AMP phosphodiesterase PgpH
VISRSPQPGGRFTRRDALRLVLSAFVLVSALTAILFIDDLPQAVNLREGDVATQQVRAPKAVRYDSAVLTALDQQEARDAVPPQYDYRAETAAAVARQQLDTLTTQLAPVDAAFKDNVTASQRTVSLTWALPQLSANGRKILLNLASDRWSVVAADAIRVLGLVQRGELRDSGLEAERRNLAERFSPQLTDDERALATEIVSPLLMANSSYSATLDQQERDAAAAAVKPHEVVVARNETVISAGQKVSAADIEKLQKLGLTEQSLDVQRLAGWFLLAIILVVVYLAWLWRYRQELWHRTRPLILLGLVLLVTAFAYKITAGRLTLPFFVPGMGASILVAILLGSGPATILTIFAAIVAGASNDLSLEVAAYVLVGGLAGIIAIGRGDRIQSFVQAGVAIGIADIAIVSTFSLLGTRDVTGVLQLFAASLAAAAGSAVAAVGTFQVLGNVFGILTGFQLLELANPSQPLLRRLLLETPGTYHHSLMVGNLAERAAEAIGADPLLARVASYYHDVGKLANPLAFIENQAGGENMHDSLSPLDSAQVLKAHVAQGIDIAYGARLPKPLIAFIPQHHGTARMGYFWAKAREEEAAPHGGLETAAGRAAADALDDRRFRHNGPKPQSREAAILMLSDSVEASVRSLGRHDEATIRGMVSRIIAERLEDGQFDECDLTLRDIERIREAFVAQLLGAYHQRIAYPQNKIVELEARREAGAAGGGGGGGGGGGSGGSGGGAGSAGPAA